MLLQYIKKIAPEDMASLRLAKEGIRLLTKLDGSSFLCEDLETCSGERGSKIKELYKKTKIVKELSSFVEPEYEFNLERNSIFNYDIFYQKATKKEAEHPHFFRCGEQQNYPPGVAIVLTEGARKHLFALGPFEKGAEGIAFLQEPTILEIAGYFCNRLPLYKQIHAILLFDRQGYEKAFGRAFTEDLIALFSAEAPTEELSKIKIPQTNLRKELLSSYSGKDKEPKKLISLLYTGLENHNEKGITGRYDTGNIKINIFLRGETKLVINAALQFPLEDFSQTLETAARDKNFNFTVNFQVENWLRQYVFMTNFAMKIFEKVKTKMLLENI